MGNLFSLLLWNMQANQPIFGGRQLGKIQNSLKYKFRENMFREKFRVFSLKKIQSKLFRVFFRVFLQNMVENHHRNRFSRKKFRVFSEFFSE
jgi:hypothetical protein